LEEEIVMPFVSGFLRLRKRGGRPDQELPGIEGPVDPDYGIDEGIGIGGGPIYPNPPPGIWPPLTPEHPWLPIAPGGGPSHPIAPGGRPEHPIAPGGGGGDERPTHPIELPPGTVWPPLPPGVSGKYLALVLIGGGGMGAMYRYVVIDADARPDNELPEGGGGGHRPSHPIAPGGRPDQGLPPTPQPKRT
jgi:hypothetical protein